MIFYLFQFKPNTYSKIIICQLSCYKTSCRKVTGCLKRIFTNKLPTHGLGYIKYTHVEDVKHEEGEEETQGDYMSFRGFGVMTRGKLDGGSCLLERGDGFRYSFARMKEGRPYGPGR